MARSRTVKPQFFLNEYLAQTSAHARLLFIGLWGLADCKGRLEDRPMRIKAALFPYENIDVESLLNELSSGTEPFIIRYAVEGNRYIEIPTFRNHQKPSSKECEKGSQIPPCPIQDPLKNAPDHNEFISGSELGATQVRPGDEKNHPGDENFYPGDKNLKPGDNPITVYLSNLSPHTAGSESNDSVCVSVNGLKKENDENQRFAQDGTDYLNSLNSPNHTNTAWVRGYLGIQFQELEQSRPDLPKPQILACWRDCCDLAIAKNATSPQWLKTTFKNKTDALTPETLKTTLPEAVKNQGTDLLSFTLIRHCLTHEIFESKNLQILPEAPNGLTDQRGTYYPFAHLEGMQEVPVNA